MFSKSIRWRFLSWLTILLIIILSCFGITAYQLNRTNRLNQINEELRQRVAAISSEVRRAPLGPSQRRNRADGPSLPPRDDFDDDRPRGPPPNDFHGGPPRDSQPPMDGPPGFRDHPPANKAIQLSTSLKLFDETQTNGYFYIIWSRNGRILKRSGNAPSGIPLPARPQRDTSIRIRTRAGWLEAYHFTELGECILSGRSINMELAGMHYFGWWLTLVGGGVLLLGLFGAWLLINQALAPLKKISATADHISAGNLAERIDVSETEGELGRLASVLNSTFSRLEAAFKQQKQFSADASHELRTPLAVIITEAQTTLAHPRTDEEYRESIRACLDAAQQMRRLAESLLALSRFDAQQDNAPRASINLAAIVENCVELIRPLATERRLTLHCDLEPAIILGNENQLSQVITNLIDNAIHYNQPPGEIRIVTRAEPAGAWLTVADNGVGISAEDLPHIFERFYRADKSRSQADDRNGLGLAISQAIVEAHGGEIHASSRLGVGSTFSIRIPAR